ncbi:MAG TPA: NAD(P)/FAD-dependent oxidoreductase [Gammaproteobacteria bacterium]|nr:NAD(P)/FAD-dependent oxidoreductase [Gammaproteobacteria bacterium]
MDSDRSRDQPAAGTRHQIIVVGGGAGGFELAVRLGRRLGRRGLADVTLVDRTPVHIWKPLLHEVAAGTLNANEDELNYLAYAHWNHFRFRLGSLETIDRAGKALILSPSFDEQGQEFIPRRKFHYDTLVVCIGSLTHDYSVPGVREHCQTLDTREQADHFHRHLLYRCYQANAQEAPLRPGQLHIAIAGAGATGVELAAELHSAVRQLVSFGLERIDPERDIRINLVEGATRVLPGLPERISAETERLLKDINIQVMTGERVTRATAEGFHTQSGKFIPAEIKIWAAGIKAPEVLKNLDGLETNHINQLSVRPTLQTTRDENIFALGDCAACPLGDGKSLVPPRAQAAHQQASLLVKSIELRLRGGARLPEYRYHDFGSLINLSHHSTIGNLMGNLMGRAGTFYMEGLLARLAYLSLYKMHLLAIQGWWPVTLKTLANLLSRRTKPRLKLH